MNILYYLAAFAVALGILIVVHEFGHYCVARWCGVKVLRFSVGFGRPLWRKVIGRDHTEWTVGAFPLGGYVKMLDEREGEVAVDELHRAFNRQPVGKRIAIVAAGPLANFLLAIVVYWGLFIHGVEELKPLLAAPAAGTVAAASGIEDGDLVRKIGDIPIQSWTDFRWEMLHRVLDKDSVSLEVVNAQHEINVRQLDLSNVDVSDETGDFVEQLGLRPYRLSIPPVIGQVVAGDVADQAGVKDGDHILSVEGKDVSSWREFVALVRASPERQIELKIQRGNQTVSLQLTPSAEKKGEQTIGRIGVAADLSAVNFDDYIIVVRYGVGEAARQAVVQTWELSVFTLQSIGKMIFGDLSWKNISGPVTIADYAGQSAQQGFSHYVRFIALISISLGVLNLLPIPVLDGGHLMYYMAEIIKGGPVSERAMEIGQQIGFALLAMLMAFAFYNDITRLISS